MFEDIRETAISVVSKVFETMFYLSIEIPEEVEGTEPSKAKPPQIIGEQEEKSPPSFLRSEIGFQGKNSGKIRLYIPYDLTRKLAANFMGVDENGLAESQVLDMAGELNNMVAGNLFSLLDKTNGYQLTVPMTERIVDLETGDITESPAVVLNFNVDNQGLNLGIQFES
jgi:CheY-specific phosphatase CheX